MSSVRRLSDDGTGRYKLKIALFVVAATLGIVGLQWARRPTDMVVDALVLLGVIGCLIWSLRSTVWYIADSVDLAGRRLTIRRGRREATVDLTQIVDVARAGWSQPGAIVLVLRSPLEGFGDAVTYRIAGAGRLRQRMRLPLWMNSARRSAWHLQATPRARLPLKEDPF
jgi:hypothetical protein